MREGEGVECLDKDICVFGNLGRIRNAFIESETLQETG